MSYERWHPVLGYTGHYSVSTHGRVYSHKSNKMLKIRHHTHGYSRVSLSRYNKVKDAYIHRLVLEAFIGPSTLHCNHLDGDKSNNKLENLEYVTRSENTLHAYRTGLLTVDRTGSKNGRANLTEQQVEIIKYKLLNKFTNKEIAKEFGVSTQTISKIRNKRTWNHV